MGIKEHTTPGNLAKYAFYWSVARMAVTGFFLLFGGMMIVRSIFFPGTGMGMLGLYQIFWLVSGAAALYLVYAWYQSDRSIFGGDDMKDKVAFWVMIVTGINQGLMGLGGGFSSSFLYSAGNVFYWLLGAAYFVAAYYLWKRWKETDGGLLNSTASSVPPEPESSGAKSDGENTPPKPPTQGAI